MTYSELKDNSDFEQIVSIKHDELKMFLADEVEKQPRWAKIANMFQITGLLVFMIGGFKASMIYIKYHNIPNLLWFFYGLLFTFTFLVIIHEIIHAITYLMIGARKLSFGVVWRKFMFYVTADRFVVDEKKFKLVALAPAVVVGILTLFGMAIFYNQPLFYFFIPIFGLHFIFCGGDFALLCFYQNRSDRKIYTFDVKEEGKTYFYGEK